MGSILQDLRYGLRLLVKNPGFSLTLVLVLALGIGGVTAMFTVVNGVLLRPLSLSHPASVAVRSRLYVPSCQGEYVPAFPSVGRVFAKE